MNEVINDEHDYEMTPNAYGNYCERSLLGRGAYGSVHWVTHRKTGEDFALKEIILRSQDGIPQNVMREIASIRSLGGTHPNIIKLVEVFVRVSPNGVRSICVLYEKCDWDLSQFINMMESPLEDSLCMHIGRQIVLGLDFLHSNFFVHRDLKPPNILINRNREIKITDFGLARHFSAQSAYTPVVVTLWYRSPELLLQCPYNSAIDVWAAGCIIAELYLGHALFSGRTEEQQLNSIFQIMGTPPVEEWPRTAVVDQDLFELHEPQKLSDCFEPMSAVCSDLLEGMLQFNPHRRSTCLKALAHPYFRIT